MNVQFKTNDGRLDPELFSTKAEKIAEEVFSGQLRSNGKANKPTQLRKFYDEILRFDGMLKSSPPEHQKAEFEKLLPYLKMLNAKAAYAMGRDLITKEFKDFLSQSLMQVKNKDDFDIFAGLFEAFMGFYKYYDEKGERPQRDHQNRGGHRK
jgi:CRISPR-associated protein Csm2